MKIKGIIALLLSAILLCGCSTNSRENEFQSQIDELKSQLESQNGESVSNNSGDASNSDEFGSGSDNDQNIGDRTYDGIDWDNIPEAPASDFGYCVYYGFRAEDPDLMAGYTGDGSELIKLVYIYDYFGHDEYVKIPKEIDGLPVTAMGEDFSRLGGHRKYPWDMNSDWTPISCDDSVFRGSDVESVFIPENLTYITQSVFDDCHTLKSISVDKNNPAYFSEDGVLFMNNRVLYSFGSNYEAVYTRLPKYSYLDDDTSKVAQIEDEGEWVWKIPSCELHGCLTDNSFEKYGYSSDRKTYFIKFTDGTYGIRDTVTDKYLPVSDYQFKYDKSLYYFRYPEGKLDSSYVIKNREHIYYEDNGDEIVSNGAAYFPNAGHDFFVFKGVQFLKELKIEHGVIGFGNAIEAGKMTKDSFNNPIAIEKITIPSSLKYIGYGTDEEVFFNNPFLGLANLKEYNVDENNPVFKSVNGVLLSKDGKILYSMPCQIGKSYTVPDGVETISSGAFVNAQNMTINIPASVKYLSFEEGGRASSRASIFNNCSDITLNVSSNTKIRDYFDSIPKICEERELCTNLTISYVD